jgi:DNA-directed RNA polymerase subunit RPC12/RpoP
MAEAMRELTWICEFCGHTVAERRPKGDDPERCESCGFERLRGFSPIDPAAEDFAEEVRRRNQAIRKAPTLSRRGRSNSRTRGS